MKRVPTAARWLGVVAAAVALAGCTVEGTPTTTGAEGSAAEPSIDIAALDTGAYPTEPRAEFGTATEENILQIEGQRMAQFVVVPFEIDADLTKSGIPTMVISTRGNLRLVFSPEVADVPANRSMLGGYVSTASTPDENLRAGNKRSLNNMVLRYQTADDAEAAARQMAAAAADTGNTRPTTLPGLPGTLVVRTNSGGDRQILAFTPRDTYVLYQWYETTPEQQDLLEPTIRKAIGLQGPLIDRFPATPTRAEAAAQGITGSSAPQIDQDHVLIYALPYTDDELADAETGVPGGSVRAVYGPRGMAHTSSDPVTDYNVLTETGSTANAVERSTVYRAETSDGGRQIVEAFLSSNRNQGWEDIDSPPGLPIATCQSKERFFYCLVQDGRYVASVSSPSPQDAYQQISAQYVILTKADQQAE
ncbi:hypothetical protein VZC37_18095 [Gordonia sp. LSe1-13]|uniref:Uncharacterized protein n=1 Tax=Gordonia sesuvii TaxID=3116777 RepID=A0ABU7MGL6_9ACTN|nr:hypothetical protein [Gordonia sp. LSe1-13]